MQWISLVGVFLGSLMLAWLLVPVMIKLAFRFNVLDHPGYHKTHKNVHPLLGGGAIFGSFMTVLILGSLALLLSPTRFFAYFPEIQRELMHQVPVFLAAFPRLLGFLVGATLLFIVGVIDDVRGVGFSYKIKFVVQALAAAILIASGTQLEFLPYPILNVIVTLIWVVGITNSFNLLDNMDGLSSGVATIISLILAILTIQQGQYFSALILLTLAGSALGFLRYNFNPSKIFMGDAGSLFLGYTLAALTVSNSYVTTASVSQLPIVVPVLVLGVPMFDTFSVMVIRWREKRPLFVGDNCHFSHRLVKLGMSARQAVTFIYLVTFCVGVSAILIPELNFYQSLIVLVQEALIFGLITLLMMKGNHLQLLHHALKQDLEKIRSLSHANGKVHVK